MAQNAGAWPRAGRVARTHRPTRRAHRGSWLTVVLVWLLSVALLAFLGYDRYQQSYGDRIYMGVSIGGVPVGGLSPTQAVAELQGQFSPSDQTRLMLQGGGRSWSPTLSELGIALDSESTIQRAYALGREGETVERLRQQWHLVWRGADIAPVYRHDQLVLQAYLAQLARELARAPRDAGLVWEGLRARALPSTPGRELDVDASLAAVTAALESNAQQPIDLVLRERSPTIESAEGAAERINAILAQPLTLTFDEVRVEAHEGSITSLTVRHRWSIDQARLTKIIQVETVALSNGQHEHRVALVVEALRPDLEAVAAAIRQEPREARFDYDPATDTLRPLVVSQDGYTLDVGTALAAIEAAIERGERTIALPVTVTPPKVSTADAAKMNIHGLAASGHSNFTSSPPEREVNVAETARRMHGIVIPPGGEFSFNEYLGWVVDATGYAESYIIVGNQTQVDVGGGVCQVSTTVFRAALNAGFPITERHAHAYRVSYYEPPLGMDATVFSPWVDLKFKNDTANYYLIESELNPTTKDLAIHLYGPPTGRQVEISNPVVTEELPPGPTIYEDDPSLPAGTTKQVDWSHPGATVRVERTVRDAASGTILSTDVFLSVYKPWQARILRGTGQ